MSENSLHYRHKGLHLTYRVILGVTIMTFYKFSCVSSVYKNYSNNCNGNSQSKWPAHCQVSGVICEVLVVTCQVSVIFAIYLTCVICQLSGVRCQSSHVVCQKKQQQEPQTFPLWDVMFHLIGVICLSGVMCQVSGIRCQVSGARCQVSGVRRQV